MKSWEVSDDIKRNRDLAALVEKSRESLEEIVGPFSQDLVDVRWDIASRGSQPTLWLTLADWSCPDGKRIELSLADLESRREREGKFNSVWSELLQVRSHELYRELNRAIQEL